MTRLGDTSFMENSGRGNKGFTLVELLIVIVVLGILAVVTVMSVTGITDKGKSTACVADHRTLVGAEEAYFAEHDTYTTMAALVAGGRLHASSTLFTLTVSPAADSFTLTGVGECAGYVEPGTPSGGGAGGGGAAGSLTGTADTITFAGMSALSYAAPGATSTVVIIDNGLSGGEDNALLDFQGVVSAGVPKAGVNLVLVDVATAISDGVVANAAAAVDAIIATNPALISNYFGGISGQTASALSNRQQFAIGGSYSPQWGIDSVLRYYDDFKLGQAGGTPIMYGPIPAVRYGSATAAHQIVLFAHGTGGDGVKADFAGLNGLPADLSVILIAFAQANSPGMFFTDWEIDAVLAQHPGVVAAIPDMGVFNTGSGSSTMTIDDYMSRNAPNGTDFAALAAGSDLSAEVNAIYTGQGWG